MAHKTLIGGTSYEIKGGRTRIGGTGYDIKSGRTLIGGTGYGISFIPAYDPVFANNDWSTIIAVCRAGLAPDEWTIGAQKAMTIGGVSYQIDIIGKNHDTYTDGGTVPMTFQLHDCYNPKYVMNASDTNVGGWTNCLIRNTYLPDIIVLMPAEVQTAIRQVDKLTSAGNQSSSIITTTDKLFLPSEIEVFGTVSNSKSGEGTQYGYYAAGYSKGKTLLGAPANCWTRSPNKRDSAGFCIIAGSNGLSYTIGASLPMCVAFAFCF